MKLIYVCSPLRGDEENNKKRANEFSKQIALNGNCPIAPHCLFTQYLDDSVHNERQIGIDMGLELLSRCDEIHVFGKIISEGMQAEIKFAKEQDITIVSDYYSNNELFEILELSNENHTLNL